MSKEKTVWYEPHPVTTERKSELIAAGYKILDIAFQPDSETGQVIDQDVSEHPEPEQSQPEIEPEQVTEPKKRGRKPSAEKEPQEA